LSSTAIGNSYSFHSQTIAGKSQNNNNYNNDRTIARAPEQTTLKLGRRRKHE
jgi:hypothetical protein